MFQEVINLQWKVPHPFLLKTRGTQVRFAYESSGFNVQAPVGSTARENMVDTQVLKDMSQLLSQSVWQQLPVPVMIWQELALSSR